MSAEVGGDGSDHRELAQPGLVKGVPTFIDKPLADMLEAVAVLHAGRLSQARGSDPVEVTQLLPQSRA